MILTGPNAIAGPTVISGGVLRVGAPPASVNLVQNGSFEAPALGADSFTYYGSLSAAQQTALAWTGGGNGASGGPALVNTSTAWGYTMPYPDGNQAMSMQNDSTLSQTIDFPQVGSYTLNWTAEARPGYTGALNILLDGATIASYPAGGVWTTFSATLNITSPGDHTIAFAGAYNVGDTATGLDDVSVVPYISGLSPQSAVQITAADAVLDLDDNFSTIGSLAGVAGSKVTLGNGDLANRRR